MVKNLKKERSTMMNDTNYRETVQSMRNRTTRMDREGDYWTETNY